MKQLSRAGYVGRVAAILAILWAAASGLPRGAESPLDPALAAYLAMGGAIADLCGDGHDPAGHPRCELCRLVGSAVLPTRAAGVGPRPSVAVRAAVAADARGPQRRRAGARSRGPPAGVV